MIFSFEENYIMGKHTRMANHVEKKAENKNKNAVDELCYDYGIEKEAGVEGAFK